MHHRPYQNTAWDFWKVRALLTESFATLGHANGWSFCRFENWQHRILAERARQDPLCHSRHAHLWIEEEEVMGVCLSEEGEDVHVVVHPDARGLQADIYSWVESQRRPLPIRTLVERGDEERQFLLSGRGYRKLGEAEYLRMYHLNQLDLHRRCPEGHSVSAFSEDGLEVARADLIGRAFGSVMPVSTYRATRQAPSYSPDLDLVVLSPEGHPVSFGICWLDPSNHVAEIEPLGTHPDFRQRGLARALVTEAFRRLQGLGFDRVLISSGAEPAVSNRLYESLGPASLLRYSTWVKGQGT